jgi:hypothetical protein
LIIGALSTHAGSANYFANRMPAVLWVLAVGSYWTFAHRMYHTWREVLRADVAAAQAAGAGVVQTTDRVDAREAVASVAEASKNDDERRVASKIVGEPQASR